MNSERRVMLQIAGIFVVCAGLEVAIQQTIHPEGLRGGSQFRSLSNAAHLVIDDQLRRPVLSGDFEDRLSESSNGVIRVASLTASNGGASGSGRLELVMHPNGAWAQELEVTVTGLLSHASFAVLIDGTWVGAFTTNAGGAGHWKLSALQP
jgi:hypothetical protein